MNSKYSFTGTKVLAFVYFILALYYAVLQLIVKNGFMWWLWNSDVPFTSSGPFVHIRRSWIRHPLGCNIFAASFSACLGIIPIDPDSALSSKSHKAFILIAGILSLGLYPSGLSHILSGFWIYCHGQVQIVVKNSDLNLCPALTPNRPCPDENDDHTHSDNSYDMIYYPFTIVVTDVKDKWHDSWILSQSKVDGMSFNQKVASAVSNRNHQ